MSDNPQASEPRILCTHRCLLDEGHDDSIQHQYGYDLPSPNDLRDKALRFRRAMFDARNERDEWRAKVDAVRELHSHDDQGFCDHCGFVWPCATRRTTDEGRWSE